MAGSILNMLCIPRHQGVINELPSVKKSAQSCTFSKLTKLTFIVSSLLNCVILAIFTLYL